MGNAGRVALQATPRGLEYPTTRVASSIGTAPPVIINGAKILQTLGVYSGQFTVEVPPLAAGQVFEQTQQISLKSFPSPFTLQKNSSGLILASMFLQNPPTQATSLVGLPSMSLFFKNGIQTGPGTGIWSLTPGVQYTGPTILATWRVAAITATPAQELAFITQAQLMGIPA